MRATTKEHARSYYRDFGQRLRTVRQTRGVAEQDAADTAKVTLRTWRRWEAGGTTRAGLWLSLFAERYDVSYDWLLEGQGPMALSEYRHLVKELAALPPSVAYAMIRGERPMLRLVK
jgi:transcriptional regulator with XRE-family HTH domain